MYDYRAIRLLFYVPLSIGGLLTSQHRPSAPRGIHTWSEQLVPFTVINDGTLHTDKISLANQFVWKDVIQPFEITHVSTPSVIPPGEVLELAYLGTRDPGQ